MKMMKLNKKLAGAVLIAVGMSVAGQAVALGTTSYLKGKNMTSNTSQTVEIKNVFWKIDGSSYTSATIDSNLLSFKANSQIANVWNLVAGSSTSNRWKVEWKCTSGSNTSTHTSESGVMDDNRSTVTFKSCDGSVEWSD